jgi:hypothetical protein
MQQLDLEKKKKKTRVPRRKAVHYCPSGAAPHCYYGLADWYYRGSSPSMTGNPQLVTCTACLYKKTPSMLAEVERRIQLILRKVRGKSK